MGSQGMRVAIVGATGAVGHELMKVLEHSRLNFDELLLYASPRSAGKTLKFRGQDLTVQVTPEGPIDAQFFHPSHPSQKKPARACLAGR